MCVSDNRGPIKKMKVNLKMFWFLDCQEFQALKINIFMVKHRENIKIWP